jgi:hypothetical protein
VVLLYGSIRSSCFLFVFHNYKITDFFGSVELYFLAPICCTLNYNLLFKKIPIGVHSSAQFQDSLPHEFQSVCDLHG